MNFDKVELDLPDGRIQTLSPQEFRSLSPVERIQGISQGRFRFFRLGSRVTARDALKVVQ
jgi:hypothetical protein